MKSENLELVRGSGNVFRDLSRKNADVEQLKALLASEIIKVLDRGKLTVRAAHAQTDGECSTLRASGPSESQAQK